VSSDFVCAESRIGLLPGRGSSYHAKGRLTSAPFGSTSKQGNTTPPWIRKKGILVDEPIAGDRRRVIKLVFGMDRSIQLATPSAKSRMLHYPKWMNLLPEIEEE
jgi:hypothetical protein